MPNLKISYDEWYPVYTAAIVKPDDLEDGLFKHANITDEELADLKRVSGEFAVWQGRLAVLRGGSAKDTAIMGVDMFIDGAM